MIEITEESISPEEAVTKAKTNSSGCVVTYVGVIRDLSEGKLVLSVEYRDSGRNASERLQQIADEASGKWQLENVVIIHRIGKLKVGDINLVVAIASAHRQEGFAACQHIIDKFKQSMPTEKIETYRAPSGGLRNEIKTDKRKEIEQKIDDLKARWPAHSVPPKMWQELEELEDQLKKAGQTQTGDSVFRIGK